MSDMQEIGALWRKTSQKSGNPFYSGDLELPGGEKVKIIAFDNDRKTKESQPDIRIYLSEDRGNGGGNRGGGSNYSQRPPASRPAPAARTETPPPASTGIEYPKEEIDPDDIPF